MLIPLLLLLVDVLVPVLLLVGLPLALRTAGAAAWPSLAVRRRE